MESGRPVTVEGLVVGHLDVWASAVRRRSAAGRGASKKVELYGVKKLRELILELAVRGLLVAQDASDEPASVLLKRIAAEKARLVKEGKVKKEKPLPPIKDEDKVFSLPSGWEFVRLGVTIDLISGQHLGPAEYFDYPKQDAIPYLTGPAEFGDFSPEPTRFTNERRSIAVVGDVLLTVKGSGVGKTNLVEVPEIAISRQLMALRPIVVGRGFLNTVMASLAEKFQSQSIGIAIPGISREDVLEAVVLLPPLAEQHRIVAKVDELMALCDQLEQHTESSLTAHQTLVETLLGALTGAADHTQFALAWQRLADHFDTLFTTEDSIDQLKQAILQLAVMGKLVPQDSSDEPAAVLLKKIAAEKARLVKEGKIKKEKALPPVAEGEKPFEVPEGWEWVRFGDLFTFLNGYAFKSEWFSEAGIRLLRNMNVLHGETRWDDVVYLPEEMKGEYEKFSLSIGDVVISLDRPIINTGLKYAIIKNEDLPCLLLQRVAKFVSVDGVVFSGFLSIWLESDFFMKSIDPGRSNGVPHISTKQLEMMVFPLSSRPEQHRIVTKVDELMALCDQLKARLTAVQATQVKLADAVAAGVLL